MGKNILITGASGFVGRNFTKELVKKNPDNNIYVLSRTKNSDRVIQDKIPILDKEQILRGDFTQELNLYPEPEIIYHLGASTDLEVSTPEELNEMKKANIEGTKNIINFAKRCKNFQHLFWMGTFYVSGLTSEVIEEDKLPKRNSFRNYYEETKWEAEKLVRESGLPFTIFRPSIIIGNSKTQDSQGERRMMYGYLLGIAYPLRKYFRTKGKRLFDNLDSNSPLEINLRLIGNNSTTKNFVCIDDVVECMLRISQTSCEGKTYNLTNKLDIFGSNIAYAIEQALNIRGIQYVGREISNPTETELAIMNYTKPFVPYAINSDPKGDTTNTDNAINGFYERVLMTPTLFTKMLKRFVEQELVRGGKDDTKI